MPRWWRGLALLAVSEGRSCAEVGVSTPYEKHE